jgi:hypothetical protein
MYLRPETIPYEERHSFSFLLLHISFAVLYGALHLLQAEVLFIQQ